MSSLSCKGYPTAGYKSANPDRYQLLKAFAHENRSHPTEAESVLWQFIKGNALDAKFLRQYIIQDYIADFACIECQLIIEVDGAYHYTNEQMEWDAYRTENLESIGFKVIRFANEDVLYNPKRVLDTIIYEINHITRTRIIK